MQTSDPFTALLTTMTELDAKRHEVDIGLFAITTTLLSLVIDAGLVPASQASERLQSILDGTTEERRNGPAGEIIRHAIALFRPGAPPPDARTFLRVIEGGRQEQDHPEG